MEENLVSQFSIEDHFAKKFSFDNAGEKWTLPDCRKLWTSDKWQESCLLSMKTRLNNVKSLLDDKDRLTWHQHTQFANPAGDVVKELRRQIRPELCTQAWAKFYEILSTYPELTRLLTKVELFNSVHLCEAPGAFITALNHFITLTKKRHKRKWSWMGVTLNPYYEGNSQSYMISDDRFILHTLENWNFGKDTTGDVTKIENLDEFKRKAEELGGICLITADGSIDCTHDPGEQENAVAWLHYCEVVASLMLLDEGGNFVVKMFTFYEAMAVCLMYLLNCAFSKVHVYKPGTSKCGNSEVYVICVGYQKRLIQGHVDLLRKSVEDQPSSTKCLFERKHIPEEFMRQLKECCLVFQSKQIEAIKRNIVLFEEAAKYESDMNTFKHYCALFYLEQCNLYAIEKTDFIVPPSRKAQPRKDFVLHLQQGSYSDLLKMPSSSVSDKLEYFANELQSLLPNEWNLSDRVRLPYARSDEGDFTRLKMTWGKPFSKILSSRFCYQYLVNLWLDMTSGFQITKCESEWSVGEEDCNVLTEWRHRFSHSCCVDLTMSNRSSQTEYQPFEMIDVFSSLEENMFNVQIIPEYDCGETDMKSFKETYGNLYEHLVWIQCILLLSQKYNCNRSVLILAGDVHTRFTAGCLFVLTCFFRKIELVRPLSAPPSNPMTWIFCTDSQRLPEEVEQKLMQMKQEVIQKAAQDIAVMEILPITLLTDNKFHSWLYSFNEKKLAQQIYRLLHTLKADSCS